MATTQGNIADENETPGIIVSAEKKMDDLS